MIFFFSSGESIEVSPVEPMIRTAEVPLSSWNFSSVRKAAKSTEPSLLNGVMRATNEPVSSFLDILVSNEAIGADTSTVARAGQRGPCMMGLRLGSLDLGLRLPCCGVSLSTGGNLACRRFEQREAADGGPDQCGAADRDQRRRHGHGDDRARSGERAGDRDRGGAADRRPDRRRAAAAAPGAARHPDPGRVHAHSRLQRRRGRRCAAVLRGVAGA